jgi:hypothetical protein
MAYQNISEPGTFIGAESSLDGKSLDLKSRKDDWMPKKTEGVVSDALSTPPKSGSYRVNPR